MDKIAQKLSKKYDYVQQIGEGGFAKVYFAIDKSNQEPVALKIMSIDTKEQKKRFTSEAKILKKLQKLEDKHISTLKKLFTLRVDDYNYGVFVLEKMEMDLLSFIMVKEKLSENEFKVIFKQVCEGVAKCHENGIAHLDLKPDNVLLQFNERNGRKVLQKIQVCDFGFAQKWKMQNSKSSIMKLKSHRIGTAEYRAPEIHNCEKVALDKADVWSLGIMLFSAITGYFPYMYDNGSITSEVDLRLIKQITAGDKCYKLVTKMLEKDYSQRLSIQDVLSDPWFDC